MNKAQAQIEHTIETNGLWKYADRETPNAELREVIPGAEALVRQLLATAKIPKAIIELFTIGPVGMKADCEFGPGESGMKDWYNGYSLYYAITFARRWASGDHRVEIGMKYPMFDAGKFADRFKVRLVSEVARDGKCPHWAYMDAEGSVYTFAPDAIGKGGYAGAVMSNAKQAVRFLNFLLGSSKHYVKALDIGFNTLGGLGIDDIDQQFPALRPIL